MRLPPRLLPLAALAVLLSPLAPALAAAQVRAAYGHVAGLVTDTLGAPIAGAEVIVVGPQRRAVSGEDGFFRLINVEAGKVPLIIRRVGFVPLSVVADVEAGQTARVAYSLAPLPARLAAVEVTGDGSAPRFTEFERRRRTGHGVYFTRADIERAQPTRTTDILRATPGLFFNDQMFGVYLVQNQRPHTASAEYCTMPVVIDGMLITGDFSPDMIDPKDIEGIEVYRGVSQVPASIPTGGTSCGVIVIWTRSHTDRDARQ